MCIQRCLIKKTYNNRKSVNQCSLQSWQITWIIQNSQCASQSVSVCTAVHCKTKVNRVMQKHFKNEDPKCFLCTNHDYKYYFLFSHIYISVPLKLNLWFVSYEYSMLHPKQQWFCWCWAPKACCSVHLSVWMQNMDLFHCRLVKVNKNFLISNHHKTKLKYLALYCKRGDMFNPHPKHTRTHTLTNIQWASTLSLCSQCDCSRATHSQS